MLFTQDSTKLQKLCPYLHVVSLLRDQIPGRAWNPDNSSFDPAPVGSTTLFVLPASSWPCLRQRTSEDRREEKKITDANTCRAKKKIVAPLPGELWFPFRQKEAVIKNVFITRENVFRYPRSREKVYRSLCCKYLYRMFVTRRVWRSWVTVVKRYNSPYLSYVDCSETTKAQGRSRMSKKTSVRPLAKTTIFAQGWKHASGLEGRNSEVRNRSELTRDFISSGRQWRSEISGRVVSPRSPTTDDNDDDDDVAVANFKVSLSYRFWSASWRALKSPPLSALVTAKFNERQENDWYRHE